MPPAPQLAPAAEPPPARAGPGLRGAGSGEPGGPRKGEGKFAKKKKEPGRGKERKKE